jgi:Flp pilus assembly protein TadD
MALEQPFNNTSDLIIGRARETVHTTKGLVLCALHPLLSSPILLLPRLFALAVMVYTSATFAYTGSTACQDCHAQEFEQWQGSHHDLAMQLPSAETVLGDFDNASFTYNGIITSFSRSGDKFIVNTDGEDGKLQNFEVEYVFGVYPLQQYLLPLSRGRLQALSIAWDSRPKEEGGQRWYHLYPDEPIDYKDPLHWTGTYMNWNTSCAECHSTDLKKNYDMATHSFDTQFAELNVGCEACHGPGEKHLDLAKAGGLKKGHSGLLTDLAQRGAWALPEGKSIAKRTTAIQSDAQIDTCARCHSRRGTLGEYHYGADLLDTHRLSMPQWPLYHPDGQINDEVYVYGSFVQSKMHQAGVVCSNCHEPHSLKLRAPDNGVCAQCHVPTKYDTPKHHNHTTDSTGALCANCHMPETTYMGVDPRRDHSLRIPRPDLSVVMGTPNACNQCHTDKDAPWALDALRQWGVHFRDTSTHPGRVFQRFLQGDNRVVPQLAQIASDKNAAPIWRATAMEALGEAGGRDAMQTASTILYDEDPMLRVSTVRSLQFLPLQQRYQLLQHLITDEVTAVRMEVAMSLAEVPLNQISLEQSNQLETLFSEYEGIMLQHADMPGTQMQLGLFYSGRGKADNAEAAYNEALRLNHQLIAAYLNLADLLRTEGREEDARQQLLKALKVAPESGAVLHSLGLLETRSGNSEAALDYLKRAAAVEASGIQHGFVYAIALHDLGQADNAITQLKTLLRRVPQEQQVLLALSNYNAELGRRKEALKYAASLISAAPGNRDYQQLYQSLSRSTTPGPVRPVPTR